MLLGPPPASAGGGARRAVGSAQPGGPAERAGLRRGDVIVGFNGAPVTDSNSLRNRVASAQPGTEVTLTVSRDNREQQVRVTLAELPSGKSSAAGEDGGGGPSDTGKLGVGVEPLTPELASRLNLPGGAQGLVVTDVDATGPAADAGVQEGDLIAEANRQPVRSVADLQAATDRAGTRPLLLLINRRGASLFLTVRPRQDGTCLSDHIRVCPRRVDPRAPARGARCSFARLIRAARLSSSVWLPEHGRPWSNR